MNYLDFTDTINQEVERNFKKKTNEIIKICNETLIKLRKEKKKLIKILDDINIEMKNNKDNNDLRFNEMFIVNTLNELEMKAFNVKKDKDRYEFINHNYEEIKYDFYRYDNNDTIDNNLTKT
jgi:hypothetical protein